MACLLDKLTWLLVTRFLMGRGGRTYPNLVELPLILCLWLSAFTALRTLPKS
jgi:hypothetical protein